MKKGGGRAKGSVFERKVAKIFADWSGSDVNRTPLSGGWAKNAKHGVKNDLISTDPNFPFGVECKHQEKWLVEELLYNKVKIFEWWKQVTEETPKDKIPLLVFHRNRSETFAMLSIDGWRKIAPTRRPRGKWMMVKTKKTGLCYILVLADFLKQIPYPQPQKKGKKK
jgi:hypothetical protein